MTDSVATDTFGISRGMIGFDREIGSYTCMAEADGLPKNRSNSSANKTARGTLSPIQVKDLGLVFA